VKVSPKRFVQGGTPVRGEVVVASGVLGGDGAKSNSLLEGHSGEAVKHPGDTVDAAILR
jgi:hypothetical protein